VDKATAIKQRAQAHIQRGSFKEAQVEFQKLLTLTPIDPYAYILLGDLALRMDHRDDAIKRYTEAGDAYEQQGFCRNAIAVLKRVLRLDPGQVNQLRRLADLYSREGLLTEAVAHYLDYGTACLKLDRQDDTRQVLEIVTQLGTPNLKVALRVIALCEALGDKQRAAIELLRVAAELEKKGQLVRARELRTRAEALAPGAKLAETSLSLGGHEAPLDPQALVELGEPSTSGEAITLEPGAELASALEAAQADGAGKPPKTLSVMPGLERSGGVFAPINSEPRESPPMLADLELGSSKGGSLGPAPSPLDLGALERAAASGIEPTAIPRPPIAPEEPAELVEPVETAEDDSPVHEYVIDAAPPEEAMAEAMREVALEPASTSAPKAEAPLDPEAAWHAAEAAKDAPAALAALAELWQQGRREREVVERLVMLAHAVGDVVTAGRWIAELGELELAAGNWAAARAHYARAIERDPDQPLARRRAERLAHLSEPAEEPVMAIEPEVPMADPIEPDMAAAEEALVEESEILEESVDAEAMAALSADEGTNGTIGVANDADVARLIDHFREQIGTQLSGEDHASHYDLGMTYLEMGLLSEAVGEFQKALGGAPYRRRCLELLATCYSRLGSPEQAAAHWRAALAADPGDGNEIELRYELACCLVAAGHLDEARDELRKVLVKSPEHLDARDRLEALEA
jgi:tetratricopeptide (TPR) repeat protein